MLSKGFIGEHRFVGHIGGDDFFAGTREGGFDQFRGQVRAILDKFRADIESFYDAASRAAGGITAVDRDGVSRQFPLMRVSAVVLELHPGRPPMSVDDLSGLIADGKKAAKRSQT